MNKSFLVRLAAVLCAALLGACAQLPTIEPQKLGSVKTIALVDIPRMRYVSLMTEHHGQLLPFSEGQDIHFLLKSDPDWTQVSKSGQATGLITALFVGIEDAARPRLLGYHDEVLRRLPATDLSSDFMSGLRAALEAKGYVVRIIDSAPTTGPRLRWPAPNGGDIVKRIPADALEAHPAVDADLVLQVSPIAYYKAIRQLHPLTPRASVAVAAYSGRTREFLGMQFFNAVFMGQVHYDKYETLVTETERAIPALREGMLSLVPQVVERLPAVAR